MTALNFDHFEINNIHPVPIIPDGRIAGECDLCLTPDTRRGPCIDPKMVFWVYEPAEPNAEWPNGIYLLDLRICEDCAEEVRNINIVRGETVQEVIQYMTEYQSRGDDIPQSFITIAGGRTVSTDIAYFSGHVYSHCDLCNTKLADKKDRYLKIYIAEYRPKRREPDTPDYVLFSFSLCSSCLEQTASETTGPASLDWDIVDYLHCFVETPTPVTH